MACTSGSNAAPCAKRIGGRPGWQQSVIVIVVLLLLPAGICRQRICSGHGSYGRERCVLRVRVVSGLLLAAASRAAAVLQLLSHRLRCCRRRRCRRSSLLCPKPEHLCLEERVCAEACRVRRVVSSGGPCRSDRCRRGAAPTAALAHAAAGVPAAAAHVAAAASAPAAGPAASAAPAAPPAASGCRVAARLALVRALRRRCSLGRLGLSRLLLLRPGGIACECKPRRLQMICRFWRRWPTWAHCNQAAQIASLKVCNHLQAPAHCTAQLDAGVAGAPPACAPLPLGLGRFAAALLQVGGRRQGALEEVQQLVAVDHVLAEAGGGARQGRGQLMCRVRWCIRVWCSAACAGMQACARAQTRSLKGRAPAANTCSGDVRPSGNRLVAAAARLHSHMARRDGLGAAVLRHRRRALAKLLQEELQGALCVAKG